MSWIDNAESGSSVRAKLNSISMVPIPSGCGRITTPVKYFDVPLSLAYEDFEFRIFSLQSDFNNPGNNLLVLAFSTDGGSTFINDMDTNGSYNHHGVVFDRFTFAEVAPCFVASEGAAMKIGLQTLNDTAETVSGVMNIMPGSAAKNPSVRFKGWTDWAEQFTSSGVAMGKTIDAVGLTGNQHLAPNGGYNFIGRCNLMRVYLAGDNQDANPNTDQSSWIAGRWTLVGLA